MLRNFLYRLLHRRHYWRHASFSEISELYASRLLRMLALHMVSLFVALFLYQNGYGLVFIAFYLAAYYAFKLLLVWPSAKLAARFGPKHGILISNFLYIPALIIFTQVPNWGMLAIVLFGLFQSISATLYDLCYHIDFSKVKHDDHAGKELGFMNFIEKFATGLSPLVGGVVATVFGAEVTIWLAATLFALSAWPLMRTAEPIRIGGRVSLRGFPWRMVLGSLRSETARGYDVIAGGAIWVLFITVVVFAGAGDEIYMQIGALSSVGFLIAFVAAFTFGKLIDSRHGRALLGWSVFAKSATYLARAWVVAPWQVVATNLTSETATTGYSMAYLRGLYDTADRSANRIGYLMLAEYAVNIGAVIACGTFGLLVWQLGDVHGLKAFFAVSAVYILLLLTARFAVYRK